MSAPKKQQGIIDARREQTRVSELVGAGGRADVDTDLPDDIADGVLADEDLAKREETARKLDNMTQSLMWLGVMVHLVSVVMRALSASRFPLRQPV